MMNEKDLKMCEGKKVFLKTTFGRFFTINVDEVSNNNLRGKDKFNELVIIDFEDIKSLVPISGNQAYGR